MTEQGRDFKGVWIPKTVWFDERLALNEKFYLAIYNQCNNLESIADKMMETIVSKTTICAIKHTLRKRELIETITSPEMAKQRVLKIKGSGDRCEWCGCKTYALEKHHYPIPKHKGGTETVLICPTCHREYHLIFKDGDE